MNIGELLVKAGKVTPGQLAAAQEQQLKTKPAVSIEQILQQAGHVSSLDVLRARGELFHLPVYERVEDAWIDAALIGKIPVDWARLHVLFPVRHDGEVIALMADPASLARLGELSLLMNLELTGALAPAEEIKKAIDRAYFEQRREAPALAASSATGAETPEEITASRSDDLLRAYDAAPVTQLVNTIILDAVRRKASDVHIEPYENHVRIRFRIDGFLYEQPAPPKHLEQSLISRLKVMSRLDIAERRLPQDGMAKVRAGEREIDIRVSTVPVAEGERVVLRLLNQASTLLPLDELGMPPHVLGRFKEVMALPHGIVLVTGPTGSGKTTTLYAALREMDTVHRNVMTVEDPIEYQMANIGQIQVKPKIGLTFASGLRHILRQDPDVILVGEIRDQETAEIAVRAALTGHLVFSTLHTNDAASAVVRLADMGIQPYLIASSVRAILAQRLVRRLCPVCRQVATIAEKDLSGLDAGIATLLRGKSCYAPAGCSLCMQGYRGRIGLYELITMGPAEQDEVRQGSRLSSLRSLAARQGASMARDAAEKVLAGLTGMDEVRRVLEPEHQDIAS